MHLSVGAPPPPALKDMARAFWEIHRDFKETAYETIIPKGSAELIFNFSNRSPIRSEIGNKVITVPRCFISAFHTVPVHLQIPDSQIFFGVYLQPTAIDKLFGISPRDLTNHCVDLALIDKSADALWHELGAQASFEDRVDVFSSWMTQRLAVADGREKIFNEFLSGSLAVQTASSLADRLCYSSRHLSRKLIELTGMNLEQTILYRKYLRGVSLIHNSTLKLTEIAHACHFSDQAHFSRTFRSFAQLSPSLYRSVKSEVSAHIFQNVR